MTPEQITSVKDELARGVDPEALKAIMRKHDYTEDAITKLFTAAKSDSASASNITSQSAATESPKKGWSLLTILLVVSGLLIISAAIVFFLYGESLLGL